ncbi:hypothetical protein TGVAND_220200 [Toxoplasma gondii VAND]|uniref:Uncharacterized protein n=1 Tax=Toxoplasma gondii VAND TaxID=933077 RepID=A0A086PIB1_TOXGO|nr:hypothetical protein TGVAND_220200 [Toxoplasma gondii VAND]
MPRPLASRRLSALRACRRTSLASVSSAGRYSSLPSAPLSLCFPDAPSVCRPFSVCRSHLYAPFSPESFDSSQRSSAQTYRHRRFISSLAAVSTVRSPTSTGNNPASPSSPVSSSSSSSVLFSSSCVLPAFSASSVSASSASSSVRFSASCVLPAFSCFHSIRERRGDRREGCLRLGSAPPLVALRRLSCEKTSELPALPKTRARFFSVNAGEGPERGEGKDAAENTGERAETQKFREEKDFPEKAGKEAEGDSAETTASRAESPTEAKDARGGGGAKDGAEDQPASVAGLPSPPSLSEESEAATASAPPAASLPPQWWDCPEALVEFLLPPPVENFFSVDGADLDRGRVEAVIRRVYTHSKADLAAPAEPSAWSSDTASATGDAPAPWLQYPEPNALWPNPLLHNHRLKPFLHPARREQGSGEAAESERKRLSGEEADAAALEAKQLRMNKHRLEHLWKFARSYGMSWDALDEVYIRFVQLKRSREAQWEAKRGEILQYAAVVAAREVREKRKKEIEEAGIDLAAVQPEHREQMLLPRSLYRKETRRLFFEWRRSFLAPWRPGGLQKLMKAVVTMRMLQRETRERFLFLDEERSKRREEREEEQARLEEELVTLLQRQAKNGVANLDLEKSEGAAATKDRTSFDIWEFDGVGAKQTGAPDIEEEEEELEGDEELGEEARG